MTDAATAAPASPIVEYSATAAALVELRERYAGVVYDVATTEGMRTAREARRTLIDLRVDIEAKRKALKAPVLERGRLLDAEAQRITSALSELEDPIDAQIKREEARKAAEKAAREAAERERVSRIQQRIAWISARTVDAVGHSSAELCAMVDQVAALPITPELYGEYMPTAIEARDAAVAKLRTMADAVAAQEAEAARIAEQRAALEREEIAQRERIAREDAERRERAAREDAERRAQREAEDAERRQRQAAEDDARRVEREAEEARLRSVREQRERAEREEAEHRARQRKELEALADPALTLAAIRGALQAYRDMRITGTEFADNVGEALARHDVARESLQALAAA